MDGETDRDNRVLCRRVGGGGDVDEDAPSSTAEVGGSNVSGTSSW